MKPSERILNLWSDATSIQIDAESLADKLQKLGDRVESLERSLEEHHRALVAAAEYCDVKPGTTGRHVENLRTAAQFAIMVANIRFDHPAKDEEEE